MWNYFFVLLWVMFMLSAGIHVFSRGFLLSRVTLKDVNQCAHMNLCDDVHNDTCLHRSRVANIFDHDMNSSSSRFCFPKKSKVILLVIDALKYDFGLYDESLKEPLAYQNRLPIIHKLRKESPERTRFMKFIADPPTTTLQRLKGLTTGSLPTFIDIGSNFATPEINEDNIIDQLILNNRTAVFMGDSTWTELYPKRFKREYPFPSFNIYDLDTVDNSIKQILPKELARTDWDILIAHFLGVDHCGHKYGPMHPEMSRKLLDMNKVITTIAASMDDETTLIVIGDHGMTRTGDHGGDTDDEVNALLFSYTKKANFHDDYEGDDSAYQMKQIDLVPTLAIILGVPIPFSNLGKINYNLLPDVAMPHFDRERQFMMYSLLNVWQMRYYQTNISTSSFGLFDSDQTARQHNAFDIVALDSTTGFSTTYRQKFHNRVKLYLDDVHLEFNDVWVKFDPSQMLQGLLFVALFIVCMYLLVGHIPVHQYEREFSTSRCVYVYSANAILATIGFLFHVELTFGSQVQSVIVLTSTFNVLFIGYRVLDNFPQISLNLHERKLGASNLLIRSMFLFTISVFFSNSFIVQEQKILCYVLMGVLCMLLYSIQKTNLRFESKAKFRVANLFSSMFVKFMLMTVFALILLRGSYSLFRCREEQGNCTEFATLSNYFEGDRKAANNKTAAGGQFSDLRPIAVLAFFVTLTRMFLNHVDNLRGHGISVIVAKYGPVVSAACIGSHFILSKAPGHGIKQTNIDALAWIVYVVVALQIFVLCWNPLLVRVRGSSDPMASIRSSSNPIPRIFKQVKDGLDPQAERLEDATDAIRIPFTDGITTAFSATFITTGVIFTMLVALLLGPDSSVGIIITFSVGAVVLLLSTVLRFQTASNMENCLQPEFLTLIAWTVLAHFSFYATEHQPTLSQIDWHAAFVGRQSPAFAHSNTISAVLVLLNTFGSAILVFFMYPLLNIFGFGLYSRFTSLIPNSYVQTKNRLIATAKPTQDVLGRLQRFELMRGDLNLYEREVTLKGNVFRTGVQLMILQGLRILCAMMACTIHCRHLMVWKVFAPKFIYEGITSYLAFAAILFGYVLIVQLHKSVELLFKRIAYNKQLFEQLENSNAPSAGDNVDVNALLHSNIAKHLKKNKSNGAATTAHHQD